MIQADLATRHIEYEASEKEHAFVPVAHVDDESAMGFGFPRGLGDGFSDLDCFAQMGGSAAGEMVRYGRPGAEAAHSQGQNANPEQQDPENTPSM